MANELKYTASAAGYTVDAVIRNDAGQVWYPVGQAFEAWGTDARTRADYAIAMTDKSGGRYVGDFDANVEAGEYDVEFTIRDGVAAADADAVMAFQTIKWDGSAAVSLYSSAQNGPGDYAVVLTIRTTGGTPVAGVSVWLSTTGTRSAAVTAPETTDSSGQVTFYLDYTTYYIHCQLSGYVFAAASFTAAAGSVAFTKDIATAVSTGADSDYDLSFLSRAIDLVRLYTNEPAVNARYSDAQIITMLEGAYCLALGEINRQKDRPIVARITLDLSTATEYLIPGTLGSVWAVYETETSTGEKAFFSPRGPYNPRGGGVWHEGNLIRVQSSNYVNQGITLTVECLPTGLARLHNGTCTVGADGTTVVFGATPHAGTLDTHVDAYVGSMLRIFNVTGSGASGNYIQERVITDYDETTRTATVTPALSPVPAAGSGGYIFYEVCPAIPMGLDNVLAFYVAWEILMIEGQDKRAKGVQMIYATNLRQVRLDAFYSHIQANTMHSDHFANRRHVQYG